MGIPKRNSFLFCTYIRSIDPATAADNESIFVADLNTVCSIWRMRDGIGWELVISCSRELHSVFLLLCGMKHGDHEHLEDYQKEEYSNLTLMINVYT